MSSSSGEVQVVSKIHEKNGADHVAVKTSKVQVAQEGVWRNIGGCWVWQPNTTASAVSVSKCRGKG